MGVRISKSINLVPGLLRLNLSKSGASISIKFGPLGTLNLSPKRGINWTGRTPIKGVTYTKKLKTTARKSRRAAPRAPATPPELKAKRADLVSALRNLDYERSTSLGAANAALKRLGHDKELEVLMLEALAHIQKETK